jgi:hypothetical protein
MKLFRNFLVGGLIGLMIFVMIPTYTRSETAIPDWLPKPSQIQGFSLLWNGTESNPNFICDPDTNITTYSQLWMKNDTTNKTVGIIAAAYMDLEKEIWDQDVKPTDLFMKYAFESAFSDFTGKSRWDFLFYLLNKTTDGKVKESNIDGFSHALEGNDSTSFFNYFIVGAIGTKFVMTFAFDINYFNDWEALLGTQIAVVLSLMVTSFIYSITILTAIFSPPCPQSDAVQVTSSQNFTPASIMLQFVSAIGTVLAPPKGTVDGYAVSVMILATVFTVVALKKKKHIQN